MATAIARKEAIVAIRSHRGDLLATIARMKAERDKGAPSAMMTMPRSKGMIKPSLFEECSA
jgi:hypothetical protein